MDSERAAFLRKPEWDDVLQIYGDGPSTSVQVVDGRFLRITKRTFYSVALSHDVGCRSADQLEIDGIIFSATCGGKVSASCGEVRVTTDDGLGAAVVLVNFERFRPGADVCLRCASRDKDADLDPCGCACLCTRCARYLCLPHELLFAHACPDCGVRITGFLPLATESSE